MTGLSWRQRMRMAPQTPRWFNPLDPDPMSGEFLEPLREGTHAPDRPCYEDPEGVALAREAEEIAAHSGSRSVEDAVAYPSVESLERIAAWQRWIDNLRTSALNSEAGATAIAKAWVLPQLCSPGWEHVTAPLGSSREVLMSEEALEFMAEARARNPRPGTDPAALADSPLDVAAVVFRLESEVAPRVLVRSKAALVAAAARFVPLEDEPWECDRCLKLWTGPGSIWLIGRSQYILSALCCHECRALIDASAHQAGHVMTWVTSYDVVGLGGAR